MKTKTNITVSVDTNILEEFKKVAVKKGLKLSTFINSKLKEIVGENKDE